MFLEITSTVDCINSYPFGKEILPGIKAQMPKEKVKEQLDQNKNISELFEDSDLGGTYYRFLYTKDSESLWISFKFTGNCKKRKHEPCLNSVWLDRYRPR